jgi:hypothetical protein
MRSGYDRIEGPEDGGEESTRRTGRWAGRIILKADETRLSEAYAASDHPGAVPVIPMGVGLAQSHSPDVGRVVEGI